MHTQKIRINSERLDRIVQRKGTNENTILVIQARRFPGERGLF